MEDKRLDPDEILREIKMEEKEEKRGKLKIFFGYAAGVGKTYAMLEAAHEVQKQGLDVVCGYIEPHTRPDTIKLLDGLETLPPLKIQHKDIELKELDLDKVLERKPDIILVDEFAHTNAEGCRHIKRYQDIEEILGNGIDVYTTVNVQHIESLCDIVASITGILVRERIPDKVFDSADQVRLVDIEPKDLLERLKEGKVYKTKQAQKAMDNFFTEEKLTALREIALRRTADRVNKASEKKKRMSGGEYYTEENILVGVSSSPSNPKIIRAAARMAKAFNGTFTALFVETPEFTSMSQENRKRLRQNLKLAQQLGAKIDTVYGEDIAFQIAEYARFSGVSKIVVGRQNLRRRFGFVTATFSDRLSEVAPNMDIYVIPDSETPPLKFKDRFSIKDKITPADFLKTIGLSAVATIIGLVLSQLNIGEAGIITFYIFASLVTAVITSHKIFSFISTILNFLAFNFFFIKPVFSVQVFDAWHITTFIIMVVVSFLTSSLAIKIKRQSRVSAQTAYRTSLLLSTNQLLQKEKDVKGIADVTANQLTKLLGKDIVFYRSEKGKLMPPKVFLAFEKEEVDARLYITDNEIAVANWVFKNNTHAGASTNTLGSAKCLYMAVRSNTDVYGVVGIALSHDESLDAFENNLTISVLSECAIAIEKEVYRQNREETQLKADNEKMIGDIFRSISHDLVTPLTKISGGADKLINNKLDKSSRNDIYEDIYDDSNWLINLIENLLCVSRLDDGTVSLETGIESIGEIVDEALKHISRKSSEHKINLDISNPNQLVKADFNMITQVIINIIDNAINYTQKGSEIIIGTEKIGKMVVVSISDTGMGITKELKTKVFDMFYTADSSKTGEKRSMGFGLPICKSIIKAHGGNITVSNNKPHGAVFKFTLKAV